MTSFVLVHGAWHGGWCWQRVLPLLRSAGHVAHAVTLTGCGERAHLLTPGIRLATHVDDVLGVVAAEELADVVLVGHSYAGMVVTGAADRLLQRAPGTLAHLVYLDAVTPHPGESWSSQHAAETVAARVQAAAANGGVALPPPDGSVFGLDGADLAWVNRRMTPQPFGVYRDALDFSPTRVAAAAAHVHRLHATGAADDRSDARARPPRARVARRRTRDRSRCDGERPGRAGRHPPFLRCRRTRMTRGDRGAAADASRRLALQRLSRLAAGAFAALATRAGADAAFPAIVQPAKPGPTAFAARAEALRQLAIAGGDQPYGAVVVCDGRIVGEGVSAVITHADPTAHAERQAIRDAQRRTGSLDLSGCVLYGTSRACPLCEAAARDARIARMAYGSSAIDAGAPGGAGR